ncbi:nicotinate-nucleotide--dimethylbenzimidazole phosphoribosyltransferase [Sulfurimicrobium lacus]|uniref:Nicotinate-nucleotide--dimethylbenzimidazole phosphoribosyltransferase n=1 Tax=Sulfurimicrobium lacus TaxID=2715678 RepID=A0A6F8VFD7_9PROT|nr:nicotinate-nucleotide--dimethylbenzimidazole phosphoribosyltransferase [Sulfurimicrobium lacus]BCB28060.1 nicotinate-nucleotide--dimethylbenzimidazole phosphoribosyltransferase [Sulfurimicrobium lacus]
MSMQWLETPAQPIDQAMLAAALARQGQLTKPPGSLGCLEEIAVRLAAMQGTQQPSLERVRITVFAADHGIADEGVSAFPQAVTGQMIANFAHGGAAISVLARNLGASLEVVDVGSKADSAAMLGVIVNKAGEGTANFRRQPAMSENQLAAALQVGRDAVIQALKDDAQLFIGGEMGIANTSAATAVACALLERSAHDIAGPGTGLDATGVSRKAQIIDDALALHRPALTSPLEILRHVGGFEIAALCGAYIASAQAGLPVLVDGFIASSAALLALRIRPDVADWLFFGHASAEPGYVHLMQALDARPLVNLDMRLGEGSGAAVALPILRLAAALHGQMATFAEAGVSAKRA